MQPSESNRSTSQRFGRGVRTLLVTLVLAATGLMGATASSAAEVAFLFEANLVPGTCGFDCLGALGGSMTGEWVFEDTATGSGGNPNIYPLISIDFTTFMGVVGGGTSGTISIANDVTSPPADGYTVGVSGEFGSAATLTLTNLTVQMIDEDGTVFSDTSLPSSAPPLAAFETAFVTMTWSDGALPTWTPVWEITLLSSVVVAGGDCCSVHSAPGCDDAVCEADVCAVDASCCTSGWDEACRSLAASLCSICDPGFGSGPFLPLLGQTPVVPPFIIGGNPDQIRGWRFRANEPGMVVTRLGVNTAVSDSTPHVVTLFDFATEMLLAQVTSPVGPGWQWVEIPPVPLVLGQDYVVQAHSSVDNWYYFGDLDDLGASWFPTGPIEYVEMRFDNDVTNPSDFPTRILNDYQYGVVDIGYAFTGDFDLAGPGAGEIVDPVTGPPGKSFDLYVTDKGMVQDLDVGIRLYDASGSPGSTTWWDDMRMSLTKGNRVFRLSHNPTATVKGLFDVVFDSDAPTSIAAAKSGGNAVGSFRPDGPAQDPMDGVMLGGRWTLNFESVNTLLNETRIEGWELLGTGMDEQTLLRCDEEGGGSGDRADLRGMRFHVDHPFQGARFNMIANVSGLYSFDAELRRSTGFTAPVEASTTMEVALGTAEHTSVPVYFDVVPVDGLESFTLKLTNFSGPGTVYFQVTVPEAEDCPNVEETSSNTSGTPLVRGDPAAFSVISVPEPGMLMMLARVSNPVEKPGLVTGTLGAMVLTIGVMAITRHQVRELYLAPFTAGVTIPAAPQWGNFLLFVLLLLAGLATVAYMIRLVHTSRATGGEAA